MVHKPTHNLCIGALIPSKGNKKSWTQVGVGWWDPEKEHMMVRTNIKLLLEPADSIYLFQRVEGEHDAPPDEEQF